MREISGYLFVIASACWFYTGVVAMTYEQPLWGFTCLGLSLWQVYTAYTLFRVSSKESKGV